VPRPPLQSLTVDGFVGCFTQSGVGPPLAFVVSPFSRIDVYWPAVAALSEHFTVTAIEPPGSGCGSVLDPPWDFQHYATWLAHFFTAQNLRPIPLVGHSNSAAIAALLAVDYPHLLSHLILVDPVGGDGPHSYLDFLVGAAVCAPFELRFCLRLVPRFLQNLRRHSKSIFKQLQQSAATDLRPFAPRIMTPTLIAWGGQDFVMPPRGAGELRGRIPNSTTYIHARGNHDWLIEHPDDFAESVRRFIAKIG
jgi:pimeloyl-ACP methyl ester carboxylesterase